MNGHDGSHRCADYIVDEIIPEIYTRYPIAPTSPGYMFSINEPDYSPALEAIADSIKSQLPPGCWNRCVADTDPNIEVLEPDCTLEEPRDRDRPASRLPCPSGTAVMVHSAP